MPPDPAMPQVARRPDLESILGPRSRFDETVGELLTERSTLARYALALEAERDGLREAIKQARGDLYWRDWSFERRTDRLLLASVMDVVYDRLGKALTEQPEETP